MARWRGKFAYCTYIVVISRRIFQTSASNMTNNTIVDIVNYLMLLLANSSQLILNFYFLSLKYGVRMRKKNTQESEDEWWARQEQDMSSLTLEWEPFF